MQVSPGSIAERAGLNFDDAIMKINGQEVQKLEVHASQIIRVLLFSYHY